MKVCIAEKPSVAKEIANVIGAQTKKNGYFEGNGYQVTWTFGHFCTLFPPEDYKPHWKRWDFNTLPMLPERFETKLMDDVGVQKQFGVIQQLLNKAELVINCGDAGQEGELIQRWVLKQAKYAGEVQRLWISSLTTEAIKEGFNKLMPAEEFDTLYYAGSARAIGDWLLGMNATRLYTLKYGAIKQVLSIGRVQTPTLAMLVSRHYEIANFTPQPYWELETIYRDTPFRYVDGRFNKLEDGNSLLDLIQNAPLTITDIERKEGKEYAPSLFDLTGLQVYCNSKFGFTADNTLKIVQKLYEMKVVTYPRVDTTFLPNDMYPKVPKILSGMQSFARYTEALAGKKLPKSKKVFNDKKVTDHHAIVPTGEEKLLGMDEQKVYDIIARRFIAVFYPDCKVAKTKVEADINEKQFTATGKEILEDGWRVLFNKESKSEEDSKEEPDGILPAFEKGESGPHEPTLIEKTTKAPSQYTEASLLRAMETAGKQVDNEELRSLMKANGIGRPSTRANIIETLFKRRYAERKKKTILPTPLGIQLIDTIQNELLKSAELTGRWEKRLKEIEDGEFNPVQFIANMKKMVADLVDEVLMEKGKKFTEPTSTPQPTAKATGLVSKDCPKCTSGKLLKGSSAYGCSAYKHGCDFRLPFTFLDKKLTEKQLIRLVEKKATSNLKGFKQGAEKAEGIIRLDESFNLQFEPKELKQQKSKGTENTIPTCPKCGKGELIKGKTAYGCSEWQTGCDFKMSFEDLRTKANGQTLTKDLFLKIIKEK